MSKRGMSREKRQQFEQLLGKTKTTLTPQERAERDVCRFHVKMIMGAGFVTIVDTRYKPLTRAMKLDVSPDTVREDNFPEIFAQVCEGLRLRGDMSEGDQALCITFPAGTTQIEVPWRGEA